MANILMFSLLTIQDVSHLVVVSKAIALDALSKAK